MLPALSARPFLRGRAGDVRAALNKTEGQLLDFLWPQPGKPTSNRVRGEKCGEDIRKGRHCP